MGGTALARQRVIDVKERSYLHFDPPLSEKRRTAFSVSPEKVVKHGFFPFLGFDQIERRIDFDTEPFWNIKNKSRPIRYASHGDAAIHSLYCDELSSEYEMFLQHRGIYDCVLAYRPGIGSNINFAKDLFYEVKKRKSCVVVCYDISGFFDNLNHEKLEAKVCSILQVSKLRKDWIRIFNRITKYEWVDSKELKKVIKKSAQQHLVCSIQQYRQSIRPIIKKNKSNHGIPQGSPLSGTLANIYMLAFDARMRTFVSTLGGSYRRYSDDIAIILPDEHDVNQVEIAMNIMLLDEFLRINTKKTTLTKFQQFGSTQLYEGDLLQYLGFTYDGQRCLLRSSSIARYYRRMKAAIRISIRAARHAGHPQNEIRRRTLVGKYTHWGDRKNFVQYAYRASQIMDSPDIRRQLRNHTVIFRTTFEKYKSRYY